MVELNQMKLEITTNQLIQVWKERKWDERGGWLRDDKFYDLSYFYHLSINSWEEMVEMRNEKNDFGKNKRRNKSHFISLINQPFYHQFDRI